MAVPLLSKVLARPTYRPMRTTAYNPLEMETGKPLECESNVFGTKVLVVHQKLYPQGIITSPNEYPLSKSKLCPNEEGDCLFDNSI